MCCALEHINYSYLYNMDLKHTKLNYGYLSLLDDLQSSSRLDPKHDPELAQKILVKTPQEMGVFIAQTEN